MYNKKKGAILTHGEMAFFINQTKWKCKKYWEWGDVTSSNQFYGFNVEYKRLFDLNDQPEHLPKPDNNGLSND